MMMAGRSLKLMSFADKMDMQEQQVLLVGQQPMRCLVLPVENSISLLEMLAVLVMKLPCSAVLALILLLKRSVPLTTLKMLELSVSVSHVFCSSKYNDGCVFIQQFILYDLVMVLRPLVV